MTASQIADRVEARLRFLPKRAFAVVQHVLHGKRMPRLAKPRTFSELLACRNLAEASPLIRQTTDKIDVRDFVAQTVGSEYLVPLRGSFDSADQITEADVVAPCVIKGAHGCDMTVLVRKGEVADLPHIRTVTSKWLSTDFADLHKEAAYEGLKQRIVIEEFLGDGTEPPTDYKFYVFNGTVAMIQVSVDRFTEHRSLMMDAHWRVLDIRGIYKAPDEIPEPPANLHEMLEIAQRLAEPFSFARVDLYNVAGSIVFGEITHNPGGGKLIWNPKGFDRALGDLWQYGTPIPEQYVAPSGR